jgi:hypothetical protein
MGIRLTVVYKTTYPIKQVLLSLYQKKIANLNFPKKGVPGVK